MRMYREQVMIYGEQIFQDDFIIFLENVVRADEEIEDNDSQNPEGGKENTKYLNRQAAREKFFKDKYLMGKTQEGMGKRDIEMTSKKFSLSRVEWLDNLYTKDQ